MTVAYEHEFSFTITRFRDGDTVEGFFECRHCRGVQRGAVRLLKLESWELDSPDRARALATADRLSNHFRGKTGLMSTRSIRRDKYGRILADIYIDDKSLALLIVEMGLGWWGVGKPDPGTISLPDQPPGLIPPAGNV